jgi:hypothetical protein
VHRLFGEARLRVMMRQQLGLRLGGLWKVLFEDLCNVLMVLLTCAPQQGLIGGILDQGVLEAVRRVRR